jgi:hypothetical protein
MDITVYLPDDLGKWAKENDLPLSRMLREAVEAEKHRREAVATTLGDASIHTLAVADVSVADDSDDFTARLHGTLIATQPIDNGKGLTEVYLGEDGKLYIYDFLGALHRDVKPDDLREHLDVAAYIKAMHAIGRVPVIDVGQAE